jgi:hypothetical protein
MLRRTVRALGALLVLFHAWLFVGQTWEGQLADPGTLVRWLVAGGLIAGLAGLRRSGAPLFLGRKAVALWLLAALLHGPATRSLTGSTNTPAQPEAAAIVLEIVTSAALGLALFLLAGVFRRARRDRVLGTSPTCQDGSTRPVSSGFALAFAARPPPLA